MLRFAGSGGDECCLPSDPCRKGEGDCDADEDCKGDLTCGVDNCPKNSTYDGPDDCCE